MNGTTKNDEEKKAIGYDFDFHIANITQEQAESLYDIITRLVETIGKDIGGGVYAVYENSEDEDVQETP